MIGHRKLDVQDYLAIARRRLRAIAIPLIVVPTLAVAVTFVLPPKYVSTSMLFVEQPKVPSEVVKPMTTGDLIERILAIQEQIFSRSKLQPLIEKYGLQNNSELGMEKAVEDLRSDIAITASQFTNGVVAGAPSPVPGLTINCSARTAWMAQDLCTNVTSMFIEVSLEQRQQLAQGTSDFLSTQLSAAKQKLDGEDAKLAQFKSQNLGRLPGDQDTNLRVLMELNGQLQGASQALDRASQDRTYAQSMLQQQLAMMRSTPSPPASGPAAAASTDELQAELAKERQALADMETQYTDKYPDVAGVENSIATLERQIRDRDAAAKKAPRAPVVAETTPINRVESSQVQQLRAQLHQDDEAIRTQSDEQKRLRAEIATTEQKLQLSPVVEEALKNLTRDHETALHFYNTLLEKRSEADMSASLEKREEGERFVVLDPPSRPVSPDFPKRALFLGGGIAVGLAIGLSLALLLESMDKSIRDERDIETLLKVRNVATLPTVRSLKGWRDETAA